MAASRDTRCGDEALQRDTFVQPLAIKQRHHTVVMGAKPENPASIAPKARMRRGGDFLEKLKTGERKRGARFHRMGDFAMLSVWQNPPLEFSAASPD